MTPEEIENAERCPGCGSIVSDRFQSCRPVGVDVTQPGYRYLAGTWGYCLHLGRHIPTPVPSEADPGAGESFHRTSADVDADLDAMTPATPDAGDVEALLWKAQGLIVSVGMDPDFGDMDARLTSCQEQASRLISDATARLASHDAATADRVRRETAEPLMVLDGLLRKWESNPAYRRGAAAAEVRTALGEHLARIAREAGR